MLTTKPTAPTNYENYKRHEMQVTAIRTRRSLMFEEGPDLSWIKPICISYKILTKRDLRHNVIE
jgi:hypothetical protein